MKKALYAVLALLGVCLIFLVYGRIQASSTDIEIEQLGAEAASAGASTFSVAVYNIAHARGAQKGTSNWSGSAADRISRSEAIGHYLAASGADIVVLNEVDFDASWSGRSDQAAVIAAAGDYRYIARQTNFRILLPGFSLSFGNAIISRYPIKTAERVPLPPLSTFESIVFGNHDVMRATVEIDDGTHLELWGIHLEVRDRATRLAAIDEMSGLIDASMPVILAGDFNSQLPDNEARISAMSTLLSAEYAQPPLLACETGATFPTLAPTRRLDWIVYSSALQVTECRLSDATYSDHLPIHATFGLRGNDKMGDQ